MKGRQRDSFIFYRSFHEAAKELSEEEKGRLYSAIINFALDGKEIALTGIVKGMFALIKPQLVANNQRFENGCRGGRPKITEGKAKDNQKETENKPKGKQKETEIKPNVNVNENVNVNVNEREGKSAPAQIKKPTPEEVKKVCKELGLNTAVGEKFYYHYEANGWTQGKDKPVLNWVAQLRSWAIKESEFKAKGTENKTEPYRERKYSEDELEALYDDLEKIEF